MSNISWQKLGEILVPLLLTLLCAILGWMASNISEINSSLAVAVVKIDEHDRRLSNLETLYLHQR